ncbi:MAG: hypothetical protein JOZ08_26190 [Verrucomicrobia bacterium]|nr:hypothetical protein [Verrucomicrobiota bacterium]
MSSRFQVSGERFSSTAATEVTQSVDVMLLQFEYWLVHGKRFGQVRFAAGLERSNAFSVSWLSLRLQPNYLEMR